MADGRPLRHRGGRARAGRTARRDGARRLVDGLTARSVLGPDAIDLATLGWSPEPAGRDSWVGQLDRRMARWTLVLHFSRSVDFRAHETNRVRNTLLTWTSCPGPRQPPNWAAPR